MGKWLQRSSERHGQHEAMMRAAANSLGFQFTKTADVGFGYDLRASNYMSGRKNGVTVDIFDYEIHHKRRNDERLGILISGFDSDIPSFALSPKTLAKTEVGLFKLTLDFESHPKFSEAYILHAGDDGDVRALFNEEVLAYFTVHTKMEVTARNNTLFFDYPRKSALAIVEALRKALEVKGVLEQATRNTEFSQRTLSQDADVLKRHDSRISKVLYYPIALFCWGCAAFLWFDAGYETAAPLIILMGLAGVAALAVGFFKGPDVDTGMNSDKYSPWKSHGE